MKRKALKFLGAVASIFVLTTAHADASDDACGMVLCLGGRILGGNGGSACSSYEKKYFSIIVTKKGKFNPSRTATKRDSELKKCAGGDRGIISKIGRRFGGARGL